VYKIALNRRPTWLRWRILGPVAKGLRVAIPGNPLGMRIYKVIFAVAFVSGVAAGLYFRDWAAIGIFGGSTLLALAIMYMVLARLFDWPKLSWREILVDIVGLFS